MTLLDVAISPFEKVVTLWPFILIGALVLAAVVVAIVLIVKFSKKKKQK